MQQHLRFSRFTPVTTKDGKISAIPGLRGTDVLWTADVQAGFFLTLKPVKMSCVLGVRVKSMAMVHIRINRTEGVYMLATLQ